MWQKIKDFWIRSYTSDRIAFYFETIASICVFTSMTWISVTAQHPPMHLIYPVSFTGAVFSIIACYIKMYSKKLNLKINLI